MTKGVKILIAIVVVAVIAGAAVLLMPKNQSSQQSASNNNSSSEGNRDSSTPSEADVTITYDGSTFSLSANSVKSGGTVKVMNSSTKNLEFDSDPHPAHTNNSELNAGAIQPGKSVVFTLEKKGKWGFHNHLNASQHGELTVE